tara:strand:- start:624 stop:1673 length:1050 start_codon:yes stop_codon:yes gene_type:complete
MKQSKIYRSFSLPLAIFAKGLERMGINHKWFIMPDQFIGWLPHSIRLGKRIIKENDINVIYASAPPYTSILIATILKQITGLPLIIDFRDPWTSNPFIKYPTRIHSNLEKMAEAWALRKANTIITVGEECKKSISESFPFIANDKITIIYNGYDPEDFLKIKPWRFDRFTILHCGSIYGLRNEQLKIFLNGCEKMKRDRILPDKFQIIFVGLLARDVKRMIKETQISEHIQHWGLKPHKEVIRYMLGADMQLLIPGASSAVTSKLFEYLATKKFILNIGSQNGGAAQIIKEANAGITIEPNLFYKGNSKKYSFITDRQMFRTKNEVISKFSRKEITEKLANIFSQVSEQ